MKKTTIFNSFKENLIFPLLLLLTYLVITGNATVRASVSSSLDICFGTLIPSVFPMLLISSLFVYVKCPSFITKIADRILFRLFGLSGNSLIILFTALTQGYPIAAKSACSGYAGGKITKEEAKIITSFFTCPGLSFAVTTAGTVYFNSAKTGFSLLFSCILSESLLCILFRLLSKPKKTNLSCSSYSVQFTSDIFVECVSDASASMINICAWVLCFSVISSLCISYIKLPLFETAAELISEVTGALIHTSGKGDLPLCAACLCFGGISVACQISPELKKLDISMPKFLFLRLLCSVTAYNTEKLYIYFFPQAVNVSSGFYTFKPYCNSAAGSVSLFILCIVFLLSVAKENKIQTNILNINK